MASLPVNRAEKALLLFGLLLPGAPCTVEKLKAIRSPGTSDQEIIS